MAAALSMLAWAAGCGSEPTGPPDRALDRAVLVALFEATGGQKWRRRDNWLTPAPLGDWYGVSTTNSGRVSYLNLSGNGLAGPLPPELGELRSLRDLHLRDNQLTGPIPPELGRLPYLIGMSLSGNQLTGPIPPELGEVGRESILLVLGTLDLSGNALTGPIPPELGNLSNGPLQILNLSQNDLTGPIPPELSQLQEIDLSGNALSGPIPPEFGETPYFSELVLSNNGALSGALPASLKSSRNLRVLMAGGTDLCAPSDPGFLAWLENLRKRRVAMCGHAKSKAYLTQAVQSRDIPVPLVAGERALLRVFVTSEVPTSAGIPPVRATFHLDGAATHVENIPGKPTPIPTEVDEGDLAKSANAEIPGPVVRPGLELVIEIDPDGTLEPGLGVTKRIPESGRLAVEVREMPTLDLTLVPFLWEPHPDSAILELTRDMADNPEEHHKLQDTRTLLPVGGIEATAHESVVSSTNDADSLFRQTRAIRVMEGASGHYVGMMSGSVSGASGVASQWDRTSFSRPASAAIAHGLGHTLGLEHAPCGGGFHPDPYFPEPDGSIGAWGYDFRGGGRLVPPATLDLMSYCAPKWIGDYHFSEALRFRLRDEAGAGATSGTTPAETVLLWGGLDGEGGPFLEPAFTVLAPPALPRSGGEYAVTGSTATGGELFSLSFDMLQVADGVRQSAVFVFALPVRPGWAGALARITLSGPGGSVTLEEDSHPPMAIFRDPQTGRVRGILRDLPPEALGNLAALAPAPGLEALLSRGLPDPADWRR